MKKIEHFIGGRYISSNTDETSLIFNPATGENISQVVSGNKNSIKEAVESAKSIFPKPKLLGLQLERACTTRDECVMCRHWKFRVGIK